MSKKNFPFKSQKELFIFYNYTNRTKLSTNVYYQKEGKLCVPYQSAHINQSKSQNHVNLHEKIIKNSK